MKISHASVSHWLRDAFLVALSAGLLLTIFPKFDIALLAWVALVPLLLALEHKALHQAFLLSHVTGVVFISAIFYWIWTVKAYNFTDYVLLEIIYLPLYLSLWGLGVAWIGRHTSLSSLLVAPSLWVTLEYIRSHLSFLSFPWALLGHSQYQVPLLIQITSITGVYGLSFLIVLVNAALAGLISHAWRPERHVRLHAVLSLPCLFPVLVAGLLLLLVLLFGAFSLPDELVGDTLRVAIVQGDTPLAHRGSISERLASLGQYSRLTQTLAQQRPNLIIWPESAIPGDVQHTPELQAQLSRLAVETHSALLVGNSEYAKFTAHNRTTTRSYNSMALFSSEGLFLGQYRKMLLVPFGEYVPLEGKFRWPKAVVSGFGNDMPGNQYTVFTWHDVSFGTVICWENIFSDHFREFVKRGAQFMVSSTNEAWFGDTAAPYELLAMTVFRAVENRVAIARAANTGISAFIDPYGRITSRLSGPDGQELFLPGTLVADVVLSRSPTFYTRYGDVFAFLQIVVCGGLLVRAWWGKLLSPVLAYHPPSMKGEGL